MAVDIEPRLAGYALQLVSEWALYNSEEQADAAIRRMDGELSAADRTAIIEAARKQRAAYVARRDQRAARVARVAEPEGSIFARQRVPFGDLMRRGVPPVRFMPSPTLGERLFYSGSLFLLAGHKKAGKSWIMAVQAADVLAAGGYVVYIDQENGVELFAERMLARGVDPEQADERFVYVPFPSEKPSLEHLRAEFEAIGEEYPGAFVVLDSLRTFMSRYGLSPNADVEVEQFLGPIMAAVKNMPEDRRVTVGIIDHSNRSTREGDEYAAAGSQAKAAAVDAVYFVNRVDKFSETVEGLMKVNAVDDRRGRLDFERFYKVGGQGEGKPFHIASVDADEVGAMGKAQASALELLADHEGEWLTTTRVVESPATAGKAAHLRRALELLAAGHPHVHSRPNPRRRDSTLYTYDPSIEKAAGGLQIG